jgi:hypothetical protein
LPGREILAPQRRQAASGDETTCGDHRRAHDQRGAPGGQARTDRQQDQSRDDCEHTATRDDGTSDNHRGMAPDVRRLVGELGARQRQLRADERSDLTREIGEQLPHRSSVGSVFHD